MALTLRGTRVAFYVVMTRPGIFQFCALTLGLACVNGSQPEAIRTAADTIEPDHVVIKARNPEQPAGSAFHFSARPADPVNDLIPGTYRWLVEVQGRQLRSSRRAPTFTLDKPGYYTVHLTVDLDTSTQALNTSRTVSTTYTVAATGPGVPGLNAARVKILPWIANSTGEVPVNVRFGYRSATALKEFRWRFGDGTRSQLATPQHRYTNYRRLEVQLDYTDIKNRKGTARTFVSLRPSKTNLTAGLKQLKRFAIYSPGLKSVDQETFNEERYKQLAAMNVNTLLPGMTVRESFWSTDDNAREGMVARLDQARRHGMGVGLIVAGKHDWFTNDTGANLRNKDAWKFNDAEAKHKLRRAATQAQHDSRWDISTHDAVGWIFLGHEIAEYADHSKRKHIRDLTKSFFPFAKLLVPYYGGIATSFEREDIPNQLRPGEGDVVFVSIAGPHSSDENGVTVRDAGRTLAELKRQRRNILPGVRNRTRLWINTNLPGEKKDHTAKDMWSATDLLDFARVVIGEGGVDLLSFRSMGRFEFDLGYGLNTNQGREFGFVKQRLAVRTIGSWIKQAKRGLPILIIRSPEIAGFASGPSLEVSYAIIGANATSTRVEFELDSGSRRTLSHVSGSVPLAMPQPGRRTLTGYLVDRNGTRIDGSEVTVPFTALPTPPKPFRAINVGGPAFTSPDGTHFKKDPKPLTDVDTTTARIAGTIEQTLYRSARRGNFTYSFQVANGTYSVTLKMSELTARRVNQRVFDVVVNDQHVAQKLDLRARTGQRFRAYDLTTRARVTDGKLTVKFIAHHGLPLLNGLVIRQLN